MIPVLAETDEGREFGSRVAKTMGLDQIDFDNEYKIEKTGAKNESPFMPEKFTRVGDPVICSDGEFVWLALLRGFSWFKTSPIVSFKKDGDKFLIETENSYYELTLA